MKERLSESSDKEAGIAYIVSGARPPVFSGEESSGTEDLRPVMVIPQETLLAGATVYNLEDNVVIFVRSTPPTPEPINFDLGA